MKRLGLLFIVLFVLVGCGMGENSDEKETTGEGGKKEQLQEPPSLTVDVQGERIQAVKGTYSWDIDNGDGTFTSLIADSAAPPMLIEDQPLTNVKSGANIELLFGVEPNNYAINIWDEDEEVERKVELDISNYIGKLIVEIIGEWDQGTARYAFGLNIID